MTPLPASVAPGSRKAGGAATPAAAPERPAPGSEPLAAALDALLGRIRLLRVSAGCARIAWQLLAAGVLLYIADRMLVLPLAVRAVLLVALALLAGRELHRRVGRPLLGGPSRLDAARLVERRQPRWQGRLVSALQLGRGAPGSLNERVLTEALALLAEGDLRTVLVARPSLREVWRAAAAVGIVAAAIGFAQPALDVFARRWMLADVAWPRATHLELIVPEQGPSHRLGSDGTLLVARGGVLEVSVRVRGSDPGLVEVVVDGERGSRSAGMSLGGEHGWLGRMVIERGDTALYVRGGDDSGDETRRALTVIEPPRLDDPAFLLEPPAYLLAAGEAVRTTGAAGLAVPEGTRITLSGTPEGRALSGELRLATGGASIPLRIDDSVLPQRVSASFVADVSDTLSLVLVGEHGLPTPDPAQFALHVAKDRAPLLRVFAPARSDAKVGRRAVVAFAVVAEDDHGVVSVAVEPTAAQAGASGSDALPVSVPAELPLEPDALRAGHYRRVLDLAAAEWGRATLPYRIVARDGRALPGLGPQSAVADGRRLEVVEDAELLRLLADRQLRLKESFRSARTRQLAVRDDVAALLAAPPAAEDPDLLAAAIAQHQVTTRLGREVQELCAVADETIWNRLDAGPGATTVLERRLEAWLLQPVDGGFAPQPWRELARDSAANRFGRLDLIGRLLDMAGLALRVQQDDSPAAWTLLSEARTAPAPALLQQALDAQDRVLAGLDELLGRMEEWEDFQEVLVLVQSLIVEQQGLRSRTQTLLSGERSTN